MLAETCGHLVLNAALQPVARACTALPFDAALGSSGCRFLPAREIRISICDSLQHIQKGCSDRRLS